MLKMIVSVKDTVADIFNENNIHLEINAASAIRSFEMSIKEIPNKDDYILYKIGDYNTDNGNITTCNPVRLYSGHDVKSKELSSISMEDQVRDLETFKKQSGAK